MKDKTARWALLSTALLISVAEGSGIQDRARFEAAAWPEADRLFQGDPYWVGSDDAYSIDLGDGRVLWLFGDTWIDPTGRHSRRAGGAKMVRNSIAVQTGYDPSRASIKFYWRDDPSGHPAAFFSRPGPDWYWPGHGIRIGDRLLLFMMRVRPSDSGLGFDVYRWAVLEVANLDDEPSAWEIRETQFPPNDLQIIVGSASLLIEGRYVYAFGAQELESRHDIYLVRWPLDDVRRGDLSGLTWWKGDSGKWDSWTDSTAAPQPVFGQAQTEFTVHHDEVTNEYVEIQTVGFGPGVIAMRSAPALTGPWSALDTIYRPPELAKPKIMIYAGKAHPQLTGADLVLTYATNSFDFGEHFADTAVYYPRFVRLARIH